MHTNFADYYQLAAIDADAAHLEKRWQGLKAFNENIETASALDLVRICFGLPQRSQVVEQAYRNAFKQEDSAFLMRDNPLELQVLAGASVIDLIEAEEPTNLTDTTARGI